MTSTQKNDNEFESEEEYGGDTFLTEGLPGIEQEQQKQSGQGISGKTQQQQQQQQVNFGQKQGQQQQGQQAPQQYQEKIGQQPSQQQYNVKGIGSQGNYGQLPPVSQGTLGQGQQGQGQQGQQRGRRGPRPGQGAQFPVERPNRPMPLPIDVRKQLIELKPRTLKDVFAHQRVEEIAFQNWKRRRPVLIPEDRMAERALNRFNRHMIHMIPVLSNKPDAQGIIGSIEVIDVIHEWLDSIEKTNQDPQIHRIMRRDFLNRPARDLMANKTYVVSTRTNLLNAVAGMMKVNHERFVIVDRDVQGDVAELQKAEADVDGILTVSDILRYFVANSARMREHPHFHKTLKELGLGRSTKTINYKERASDAFKKIGKEDVYGFAVVDDNGKLIGNLSACDLKGITRYNCPVLLNSVEDYLMRDLKREWFYKPLILDPNDTLYLAIHQFVSLGKERFYFVDSDGKPTAEISRRDILTQCWNVLQ